MVGDLHILEARRHLGRASVGDAVALAMDFLQSGQERESVLILAAESVDAEWLDVLPVWRRVLSDFSVPSFSSGPHALCFLLVPEAKGIAEAYRAGTLTWFDAALQLERLSEEWGRPPLLDSFSGIVATWYYRREEMGVAEGEMADLQKETSERIERIAGLPSWDDDSRPSADPAFVTLFTPRYPLS